LVAATVDPTLARVVIVDESADSREVFYTLLNSRGVRSLAVSGAREGLELIRRHHPAVVVLDLDAQEAESEQLRDEFDAATRESCAALVVLGDARHYLERLPDAQVIAKPYHYGPVLRTIECLLVRQAALSG
jgi:DNA-binding NtrC family response regulator